MPENPFDAIVPTQNTTPSTPSAPKARDTYDFFGRKVTREAVKGQYTNLYVVYHDLTIEGQTTREFLGKIEMRSFVSPDTIEEVIKRIFGSGAQFDRVDLRGLTPEAKAILNKLDAYAFHPAWNASTAATGLGNAWANTLAEAKAEAQSHNEKIFGGPAIATQ